MKSWVRSGGGYSALNRAPPSPPRMIARINAKKRSPYSAGGTGLILCCITHTKISNAQKWGMSE